MPIYDNDGTTNYQIGKLYDNDGTTNYQIGKVYDNDGTTNYLIYNVEMALGSLASGEKWDCRGYDTLSFDFSITGTWGYWDAGGGYISGRSLTFNLCLADGTVIYTKTQSYGDASLNFPGTDQRTFTGNGSVSLSGYSDAQLVGVYLSGTIGGNASSVTNYYQTVNSVSASNGLLT